MDPPSPPPGPASLGALIEALVDGAEQELRERLLVEAALSAGCAAACLWRDLPAGRGNAGGWTPVRSIGDRGRLPPSPAVRAVLESGMDGALGERASVLRGAGAGRTLALAVAWQGADASAADWVDALLAVYLACEPCAPGVAAEDAPAALPRRRDASAEPGTPHSSTHAEEPRDASHEDEPRAQDAT